MTYAKDGTVTSADFASLASDVNAIWNDNNSGSTTESVANNGYGQSPAISSVSTGTIISAAQWNQLFSVIDKLAIHQGTTKGSLVPSSVSAGDLITAYEGTQGLEQTITNLTTRRMFAASSQMTITSNGAKAKSTRTSAWTGSVTHVVEVNFGSWNSARYFFNSGGQIRFSASRSGGASNSQNTSITNLLNSVGTVKMNHTNTLRNDNSVYSNTGFYNLTTSDQTIYSQYGTGTYSSDRYAINAKLNAAAGSASKIIFTVYVFETNDTNPSWNESVSGTLVSNIDEQRATGSNVSVVSPSFSTTNNL